MQNLPAGKSFVGKRRAKVFAVGREKSANEIVRKEYNGKGRRIPFEQELPCPGRGAPGSPEERQKAHGKIFQLRKSSFAVERLALAWPLLSVRSRDSNAEKAVKPAIDSDRLETDIY
jgi:hypothetical protein